MNQKSPRVQLMEKVEAETQTDVFDLGSAEKILEDMTLDDKRIIISKFKSLTSEEDADVE